MRIFGIDPGSRATGYGIVERRDGETVHVAHGTLRPDAGAALSDRLAALHAGLSGLIARERPEVAVVEQVFVAANARSALVLGQARGTVLAALGAARIPVHELAPRAIKSAVTGSGGASKDQVQRMVARLLALDAPPPSDAADALAAAICQAQLGRLAGLAPPGRRRRSLRAVLRS